MIRFLTSVRSIATLALSTMLLASCSDDTVDPGTAATFTNVKTEIFAKKCATSGCHVGSTAPHNLDMTDANLYGKLVNFNSEQVSALKRIEPNNTDSSYLMIKVEGKPRMAPGTVRMPATGSPLTSDELDLLRRWINDGAKNN